jgi:hypothetical protein
MTVVEELVGVLRPFGLVYLATPYTKYKWGLDAAAVDAAKITGRLIQLGVNTFSPIVHSHWVAMAAGIDPIDHEFWLNADEAFMHKSDALLVCRMSGWQESYGVNEEIKYFDKANKPIFYLDPGFTL